MPGARLTAGERERIATGLQSGHGYAAIARQLGRPTSTVSREVARNGGRVAYTAPATHRPPHPATVNTEAVHRFAEEYAHMIQLAGMPRMPGRVLAQLLVTDSGALSARELCQRLSVSPGAISKAIRFLEAFSLVRRERPAGRRQELYVFDADWAETFTRREELFAPWEDGARRGAELLGPQTPAGARIAELAHFMRMVRGTIVQVRERWRRIQAA